MRPLKSLASLLPALALVICTTSNPANALLVGADNQLNVAAISVNLNTGGFTDTDINDTNEAVTLWTQFDTNGAGSFTNGTVSAIAPQPNRTYNVQNINLNTNFTEVDFAGGGGNFGTNNAYAGIGAGAFNEDFSVRAQTSITFANAGTYRISIASDDGRFGFLTGATLDSNSVGQVTQGPGFGQAGDNAWGFNNPTGHNNSVAQITVGAGAVVGLDAFMYERGGGDSFEIAIANGAGGACCGGFELLTNGSLGGTVSTTGFNVSSFEIIPGGGENDSDINTANEALVIWNAIDGGATAGLVNAGGGLDIQQDRTYNITGARDVENQNLVNYGGGAGHANAAATAYDSINGDGPGGAGGPINGGDDFSVRVEGFVRFLQGGVYSIAAVSDDGRRVILTESLDSDGNPFAGFTATAGQQDGGQDAFTLFRNAPTGHAETVGVFEVGTDDVLALDALFNERGGGDSFEMYIFIGDAIALNGGDGYDGGGPEAQGWMLLSDAVNQGLIQISSVPIINIPEPATALLGLMGLAGLATRRRRNAA